jgi:hypothetical protein
LLGSGKSDREMLDELFWTVLTRAPEQAELQRFSALLTAGDKRAALEDILWALLNAKEFVLRR